MFGLFKPKMAPNDPVEFKLTVEVEATPEALYRLVDWADPGNAKIQLGHRVEPVDGKPDEFVLVMKQMQDLRFPMRVTDAAPHRVYEYVSTPQPKVGKLEYTRERYEFTPTDSGGCELTLITTAKFDDDMRLKHFTTELERMAQATLQAMGKLKLQAEQGAEAVKQVEMLQFS